MDKRKVTILDAASDAVAEAAFSIESKGMPQTAKEFVDEAFDFFADLGDDRIVHHPLFISILENSELPLYYFQKKKYCRLPEF